MKKESARPAISLPFVMATSWMGRIMVVLLWIICLFLYFGVWVGWNKDSVTWADIVWPGLVTALAVYLWTALGTVTCDERGFSIATMGITFCKVPWDRVRKVRLSESADAANSQPRFLIYHEGAFLGMPVWINNFMYRRADLARFILVLRQKAKNAGG